MDDLLAIARRLLKESGPGEKVDKPPEPTPFSPLSPLFHCQGEPWNGMKAVRLMSDLDDLVERLGVQGDDPSLREPALMVMSAYKTRDMETVRFACSEFEAQVRTLAGEKRAIRVKSSSLRFGVCFRCGINCALTCSICLKCLSAEEEQR